MFYSVSCIFSNCLFFTIFVSWILSKVAELALGHLSAHLKNKNILLFVDIFGAISSLAICILAFVTFGELLRLALQLQGCIS